VTLHERGVNADGSAAGQQSVQLTRKQQETLSWVAEGKTSWEISVIMRCKEETVNYHVKGILRRLCATNKAHAVSKAMRLGLLAPGTSCTEAGAASSSRSRTTHQ
jgi:DNA-binding CsgD family transcriptional regulator